MRTADNDVGSPEGSCEEDEDVSGSGSEDDSSGEDGSEEGSGSEASEASEASGSELDLALAEDGRVACPLLPHLAGLDAFSSFPNACSTESNQSLQHRPPFLFLVVSKSVWEQIVTKP